MPYTTKDRERIQRKYGYTKHEADIFIKAFNAALDEYGDEERAFKVAHSAVNKYQEKKKKRKKVQKALPVGEWEKDHILEEEPEEEEYEDETFSEYFSEGFLAGIQAVAETYKDYVREEIEAEDENILELFEKAMQGGPVMSVQMPDGSVWSQRVLVDTDDFTLSALRPAERMVGESVFVGFAKNATGANSLRILAEGKKMLLVRPGPDGNLYIERL